MKGMKYASIQEINLNMIKFKYAIFTVGFMIKLCL